MSAENNNEKPPLAIEDAIREKLAGDTRRNALDYVAFLRSHGLPLNANEDGWFVGGWFGSSIAFLVIRGHGKEEEPWAVCLFSCDFGGDGSADDGLKEAAWAHARPCKKCHEGWNNCGRADRTIFGRGFEALCLSPVVFENPDAETLESARKLTLMLMEKRATSPADTPDSTSAN